MLSVEPQVVPVVELLLDPGAAGDIGQGMGSLAGHWPALQCQ